jgi:hypothetical protein
MTVRTEDTKVLEAIVAVVAVHVIECQRNPLTEPLVQTTSFTSSLLQPLRDESPSEGR